MPDPTPNVPPTCILHAQTLQETHDGVIAILAKLDAQEKRIGNLEHSVYGNGKPGVLADATEAVDFARGFKKFLWLSAVPVVGLLVGGVVWVIKSMPVHP